MLKEKEINLTFRFGKEVLHVCIVPDVSSVGLSRRGSSPNVCKYAHGSGGVWEGDEMKRTFVHTWKVRTTHKKFNRQRR